MFAPRPAVTFGSLSGDAETTMKFTLAQKAREIALLDFVLKPSKGSWKTTGFSAGAVIGELKFGTTIYELKVKSSDSSKLVIDGVEKGKSEPDFTLEATNTGGAALSLKPTKMQETLKLDSDLLLEVNFTQPVLKLPSGSGASFDMNMDFRSMPERTKLTPTSLPASRKQAFVTN